MVEPTVHVPGVVRVQDPRAVVLLEREAESTRALPKARTLGRGAPQGTARRKSTQGKKNKSIAPAGFEPAPPKRPEPYSGALDQLGHRTMAMTEGSPSVDLATSAAVRPPRLTEGRTRSATWPAHLWWRQRQHCHQSGSGAVNANECCVFMSSIGPGRSPPGLLGRSRWSCTESRSQPTLMMSFACTWWSGEAAWCCMLPVWTPGKGRGIRR